VKRRAPKASPVFWVSLALGLITFALYSPSLAHAFLTYDDQQYVTENRHVQAGLTWNSLVWAFTSFFASNWHPLTWLSHILDYQVYGLHPAGHHLTNVLLHTLNTVLLFLVLKRMTGALWRSACVAALFAWHPLHVESVAWISERKDVLSGFFFMLTLLAYVQYVRAKGEPVCSVLHVPSSAGDHATRNTQHATRSTLYYSLALLCFTLGLMSKPMLVPLPFILLLLDYWPLGRLSTGRDRRSEVRGQNSVAASSPQPSSPKEEREKPPAYTPVSSIRHPVSTQHPGTSIQDSTSGIRPSSIIHHPSAPPLRPLLEKLPFLLLSLAGCVLTLAAQHQASSVASAAGLPLERRLAHALLSYAHYFGAMLVPRHLAVFYPYPAPQVWTAIPGAGLLLGFVSLLALRSARRLPYLLVGWAWFLGMLVPVIGLVQVGDQAWADRYTYLPSVGLFIAAIWGLAELAARTLPRNHVPAGRGEGVSEPVSSDARFMGTKSRVAFCSVSLVVGAALLAATTLQLRYWKDTRTLFQRTAEVTQNNGRAMTLLGSLLAQEGKVREAMDLYRQALSIRPDDPEAHFFMGAAYEQQGKPDEAIAEYTQALWFKPLQERTHLALGLLLARQNHDEAAAVHYRAALALNPESAQAENNLARLLHKQGRWDEAIGHYQVALRLDPNLAQAHNNLGVLLLQKDKLAEGVAQLRTAVRLRPGDLESKYNLALALNQQENWAQAADLLAHLAPARPNDPKLHYELARALAHLGKTREAMSHYAEALLRQTDFPEALDGLSWILATNPQAEYRNGTEAVRMAERACELTWRKDPAKLQTLAAAYAETGRFPEAVSTAQTALDICARDGNQALEDTCRRMRDSFQSVQPWREVAH
jgi:tetratricopeptide (TPR) repeat protein